MQNIQKTVELKFVGNDADLIKMKNRVVELESAIRNTGKAAPTKIIGDTAGAYDKLNASAGKVSAALNGNSQVFATLQKYSGLIGQVAAGGGVLAGLTMMLRMADEGLKIQEEARKAGISESVMLQLKAAMEKSTDLLKTIGQGRERILGNWETYAPMLRQEGILSKGQLGNMSNEQIYELLSKTQNPELVKAFGVDGDLVKGVGASVKDAFAVVANEVFGQGSPFSTLLSDISKAIIDNKNAISGLINIGIGGGVAYAGYKGFGKMYDVSQDLDGKARSYMRDYSSLNSQLAAVQRDKDILLERKNEDMFTLSSQLNAFNQSQLKQKRNKDFLVKNFFRSNDGQPIDVADLISEINKSDVIKDLENQIFANLREQGKMFGAPFEGQQSREEYKADLNKRLEWSTQQHKAISRLLYFTDKESKESEKIAAIKHRLQLNLDETIRQVREENQITKSLKQKRFEARESQYMSNLLSSASALLGVWSVIGGVIGAGLMAKEAGEEFGRQYVSGEGILGYKGDIGYTIGWWMGQINAEVSPEKLAYLDAYAKKLKRINDEIRGFTTDYWQAKGRFDEAESRRIIQRQANEENKYTDWQLGFILTQRIVNQMDIRTRAESELERVRAGMKINADNPDMEAIKRISELQNTIAEATESLAESEQRLYDVRKRQSELLDRLLNQYDTALKTDKERADAYEKAKLTMNETPEQRESRIYDAYIDTRLKLDELLKQVAEEGVNVSPDTQERFREAEKDFNSASAEYWAFAMEQLKRQEGVSGTYAAVIQGVIADSLAASGQFLGTSLTTKTIQEKSYDELRKQTDLMRDIANSTSGLNAAL